MNSHLSCSVDWNFSGHCILFLIYQKEFYATIERAGKQAKNSLLKRKECAKSIYKCDSFMVQ